jgi:hypothetical protein
MSNQATVSDSLTGRFRYIVLVVWVVGGAIVGWVSLTDRDLVFGRVVFGLFLVLPTLWFLFLAKKEYALVSNHLVACGEVVSYCAATRRARAKVNYRFLAMDGQRYAASSDLFTCRGFQTGEQIHILYDPLVPKKSRPLGGFLFYEFDEPEASS